MRVEESQKTNFMPHFDELTGHRIGYEATKRIADKAERGLMLGLQQSTHVVIGSVLHTRRIDCGTPIKLLRFDCVQRIAARKMSGEITVEHDSTIAAMDAEKGGMVAFFTNSDEVAHRWA